MKKYTFGRLTLFLFVLLQIGSLLMQLFLTPETIHNYFVLNILASLGKSISENWVAFSLILIFSIVGYLFYNEVFSSDDHANTNNCNGYAVRALILAALNFILCNKLYSTESISQKIIFLKAHIDSVIFLVVVLACCAAIILLDRRIKRINKDLEKNRISSTEPQESQNLQPNTSDTDELISFKIGHPIAYYFRTLACYNLEVKKLKLERKKKALNLKMQYDEKRTESRLQAIGQKAGNNLQNKLTGCILKIKSGGFLNNIAIAISMLLTIIFSCFIVYNLFNENSSLLTIFDNLAKRIVDPDNISEQVKNIELSSSAVMECLQSIGLIFLIIAVCFVTSLVIYIIIRIMIYLLFVHNEDENPIKKCAKLIKIFVFTSCESGMRLLLFIPDFIEKVEDVLLNMNLDEKICEFYPESDTGEKGKNDDNNKKQLQEHQPHD